MGAPNITSDQAEKLTWGDPEEDPRIKVMGRFRGDDRRWESEWTLVVMYEGELWGVNYREPLTEIQDSGYGPFEYGIDWYPVEAYEHTETRYRKVGD